MTTLEARYDNQLFFPPFDAMSEKEARAQERLDEEKLEKLIETHMDDAIFMNELIGNNTVMMANFIAMMKAVREGKDEKVLIFAKSAYTEFISDVTPYLSKKI